MYLKGPKCLLVFVVDDKGVQICNF